MSNNDDYLRTGSDSFRLTADITLLMLKGAGYALAVCFVIGIGIWGLVSIGNLLPWLLPDTWQEMPDPISRSWNERF